MKRIIVTFVLICAFALPLAAQAAWWNPSTWNKKTDTSSFDLKIKELEDKISDLTSASTEPEEPLAADTSKLDAQIASLTQENAQLRAQIKTLTAKVASYEAPKAPVKESSPAPAINTSAERAIVTQQFIPSADGSGYGYYQATLKVTAGNTNLYIPRTTTDSALEDVIGISYSVIGEDSNSFKGIRKSTVSCTTTKTRSGGADGSDCFVEKNTSLDIEVKIRMSPDDAGSFAIKLGEIRYYIESGVNRFAISSNKIKIEGEIESEFLYIR